MCPVHQIRGCLYVTNLMSVDVPVEEVFNLAEVGHDAMLMHGLDFVWSLVPGLDTSMVAAYLVANT